MHKGIECSPKAKPNSALLKDKISGIAMHYGILMSFVIFLAQSKPELWINVNYSFNTIGMLKKEI